MIKKFINYIRKKTNKYETVVIFKDEDIDYRVLDIKNPLPFFKDVRQLQMHVSGDNTSYVSSSVFLDTKNITQPIFALPQKAFEIWSKKNKFQSSIVLGCAGCSMPRYFILKEKECSVIGVEYSKAMVEAAKKYFWIDEYNSRFELYYDDAFAFISDKKAEKMFNAVYVDIFVSNSIDSRVYSDSFLNSLYNQMTDSSIAVINALNEKAESIYENLKNTQAPFTGKYILSVNDRRCVILLKESSQKLVEYYESEYERCGNLIKI